MRRFLELSPMTTTPMLDFVFIAALAAPQTTTIRVIPPPADVAAPPADATKTASGLVSKVIVAGTGTTHPTPVDLVTVDYTGWTVAGKMFDSSVSRGKTATFPLDRVMAGWTEGVQLMVTGETRRFWIPQALAKKGQGDPKGTLVFDVKLMSFTESPTHPPADVKKPPSDAERTASGLIYKVLTAGVGGRHPKPTSVITVHFSGWTMDGTLFVSSVVKGMPATLLLNTEIPGWIEGVQLMVEGEKARFWIPEKLANNGQGPGPKGDLVFDIELIKIN
jgi:FKBP-type peptidyl-prolyl cis-trans isomerase